MNKKAVIFDLDGTLIDSLYDISQCANEVLHKLGHNTHDIEKYKEFVGDGAMILMKNALPDDISEELLLEAFESFKNIYDKNIYSNTKPYEGIYELLTKLERHKYLIGILSNKPHKFTVRYAKKLFNEYHFHEVHGQKEHIPKKPDPIGAINIAKSFKIPSEEIYYVGDTGTDMKTAKNAGMIAVGVLWGFRDETELLQNGADYIVKNPAELWEVLNQ